MVVIGVEVIKYGIVHMMLGLFHLSDKNQISTLPMIVVKNKFERKKLAGNWR
jgi:hypothetical protein